MVNLLFLRHCESTFNSGETPDKKDPGLSLKGIEQAKNLRDNDDRYFDLILCSTLRRARETLEYGKLDASKIKFTDICREITIDYCDFLEGEDIFLEQAIDIDRRIQKLIKILRDSSLDKIMVISHHDFIKELTGISLGNGEILEICY